MMSTKIAGICKKMEYIQIAFIIIVVCDEPPLMLFYPSFY